MQEPVCPRCPRCSIDPFVERYGGRLLGGAEAEGTSGRTRIGVTHGSLFAKCIMNHSRIVPYCSIVFTSILWQLEVVSKFPAS